MTRSKAEPLSEEQITELAEIFDVLAQFGYEDKITEMLEREDPVWFSPLNVIHHASQLNKSLSDKEKKDKKFRKVVEANMAAVMLVGLMSLEDKQYWMQCVDDKHGSPDIMTLCYSDRSSKEFDNMDYQDLEVVEYETHSQGNIAEFLAKTKLSSKKAYDEGTHILCYVGGGAIVTTPNEEDLTAQMKTLNSTLPIVLLGLKSQGTQIYKLTQLNPVARVLAEFDLQKELIKLSKNGYVGVLNLKRGKKRPMEKKPNEKHYPFEKLGYIPNSSNEY